MATERARFSVSLDAELYKRVEDFRFDNRFSQMSRAVEALIMKGLDAYDAEQNEMLSQQPESSITPEEAFGETLEEANGENILREREKV